MSKKIPRVYVIEGLDGVGKTTAAKKLAERLGGSYLATPPEAYKKMTELYEADPRMAGRFEFFMNGNYYLSEILRRNPPKSPVIVDRYVLSTIAYHNALLEKDVGDEVEWDRLIKPDLGFYLFATRDVRNQRMSKRNNNSKTDEMMQHDLDLADRIEEQYGLLTRDYQKIDTTALNLDQVVDAMQSYVQDKTKAA
jgi:thymidylate kinase